jgi:integrase
MSSVHLSDSKPNWFCHFYDPEGFRRKRSTGTSNRRIATTICSCIERASTLARAGKLSNEKALKLIRETRAQIEDSHGKLQADAAHNVLKGTMEEFVKIAGGELESYTVRSWLQTWLSGKTDASKATLIEYRRIADLFTKFLGARADRAITALQMRQVEEFKADLAKRVAPSTVNKGVKVLKAAFAEAVKRRQLEFSPAEHIAFVETESTGRRPFTSEEIQKLLKHADQDWRIMILLGYYTGLRLQDCASLTWREVDLHGGLIAKRTQKTGRPIENPIHETLALHLEKIAGDDPDAPLCPSLHGKSSAWLSGQFHELMAEAGLVAARERKRKTHGKGRDARRELKRISFHSLRYNTTSALKSAGVGDSVAMDIVGHDTEAMSRNYTDIPLDVKRSAVNKLPDITK